MRLIKFTIDGVAKTGTVEGDQITPLGGGELLDAIWRDGNQPLADLAPTTRRRYALDEVRLLPPVVRHPRCLFATGWNYRTHFEEGQGKRGGDVEEPTVPTFFSKPASTIVGPHDPISIDQDVSSQFDYEAELAVVIGRPGRNISQADAFSHVFGYMVANDVSARDVQRRHGGQWFKGKAMDRTCPLGPWIVTADEIPEPEALTIDCLVNGEVRQHADTASMAFPIPRLLEELSAGMTLLPGDILLTGTPAGVGFARTPPTYLVDGDQVISRISSIGELQNRVRQVQPTDSMPEYGAAYAVD